MKFNGSLTRAYELTYLDSSHFADTFNKSVLSGVAMRGTPGDAASELYRHTFDYFTAPSTGAMFDEPQVWGTLAKSNGSERTDDGLSHSDDELFGASGDVGIGFLDIFSATIGGGGDSGSTTPNLLFLDGNGDGLPDQMDRAGFADLNVLAGVTSNAHFGEITFPNAGGLGHTNRSGWTATGSLSAFDGLFGVSGSYSQHTAEDDQVVADMNGDGFPDIVTNSGGSVSVQLNTGFKTFAAPQAWNGYSLGGVQFTRQDRWGQANQAGAFFPADPLIRWVAPFAGSITAQATFQKVKAGGDGVRVDMFLNGGATPQGTCAFGPNDLGPCTINISPTVAAGDRIYTKVTALNDPGSDELTSAMTVTYNNIPASLASQVEPYGAPLYNFDRSADFRLGGLAQLPWTASADGTVNVQSCFTKTSTADDITAVVTQMNGNNLVQEFDFPVPATSTGTFCIPQLQQPLSVQTDQTLFFALKSDVQIDPNTVSWPAAVAYSSYCRRDPQTHNDVCGTPACSGGFCTIGSSDPLPDFPVPQGLVQAPGHVYYPVPVWTPTTPGPTLSTTAPAAGATPINWTVSSSAANNLILLVQGVNKVLAKQHLTTGTASIQVSPTLQAGEQIFFSVLSPTGAPVQPLSIGVPTINGSAVPNVVNVLIPDTSLDNVNATMPRDPMSGGYHRWWYGDWNGSRPFNQAQIVVSSNPKKTDSFLFSTPSFGLSSRPDSRDRSAVDWSGQRRADGGRPHQPGILRVRRRDGRRRRSPGAARRRYLERRPAGVGRGAVGGRQCRRLDDRHRPVRRQRRQVPGLGHVRGRSVQRRRGGVFQPRAGRHGAGRGRRCAVHDERVVAVRDQPGRRRAAHQPDQHRLSDQEACLDRRGERQHRLRRQLDAHRFHRHQRGRTSRPRLASPRR